jgi:lipopolysaccharide biosynthesis regulator YciM
MSRGDEDAAGCAMIAILFIAIFMIAFYGFMLGRESGRKQHQREAVKVGAAEYIADENGVSTWRWKE